MTSPVRVSLGPRSYDITFGQGGGFPDAKTAFVITDTNVEPHAEPVARALRDAGMSVRLMAVPAGESSKSLAEAERIYDGLAEWPADRRTLVVAVGGGVVGDLAGFVAATYARGLRLLMVPTTLLAMVDSSVGGKVGVNHRLGKNLIGAFHQPVGVRINIDFLATLPEREFLSGLAEVVKYGMIMDPEFFESLERNADAILARDTAIMNDVVARCCRLKADVVEQDEREETGLRMILNYGHTFAHVFESVGGYGTWLHGEAVAAGMVCASRLAERLGMIDTELTERQSRLLKRFGLPTTPRPEWSANDLIRGMYRDKKAGDGKLRFVLPTRLGEVKIVGAVDEAEVREVLAMREP